MAWRTDDQDLSWVPEPAARLLRSPAEVVPFIGAGISIGAGIPSGSHLAAELLRRGGERGIDFAELAGEDREDCRRVADCWARRDPAVEEDIRAAVEEVISAAEVDCRPTLCQRELVKTPSRICLTLNYDLSLERAAEQQGIDHRSILVDEIDNDLLTKIARPGEHPLLVVHLHGSLADRKSLVLAGGAYQEAALSPGRRLMEHVLLTLRVCLLGVSFDEGYIATLFQENAPRDPRHVFVGPAAEVQKIRSGRGAIGEVTHAIAFAPFPDGEFAVLDAFARRLTSPPEDPSDVPDDEILNGRRDSVLDLFHDQDWREREGLGEALLQGPLTHAKAQELIEDAQRLAEADPLAAARSMQAACVRLREVGIGTIAESYEEQAAELLLSAGRGDEAVEILIALAGARLDRGSDLAQRTVRRIEGITQAKPDWLDPLLQALLYWPIDPEGSLKECVALAGKTGIPPVWLRRIFELLVVHEKWEEILEIAAVVDLGTESIDFRITLCIAEARFSVDGDDDGWLELLDWAARQSDSRIAGFVWQRRGHHLAMRDEVDSAIAAYRNAMRAWSRAPEGEEQVAEGYYCILNICSRAARKPPDPKLMPLASELRGDSDFPGARAERLEQVGMSQRLAGRLRESVFSYSRSLLIHRAAGDFYGVVRLRELLAGLEEEAGENLAALSDYLAAGQAKEATHLARGVDRAGLLDRLRLVGPTWVRAAEYRVIASVGEELPADFVARVAPRMIADSALPFEGFMGPSVSVSARLGLAAIASKIGADDRDAALRILREDLEHSFAENTEAAAKALAMGSELGLWDEVSALVEATLSDRSHTGLGSAWLARQAVERDDIAARLKRAALDGNRSALVALAEGELDAGVPLISSSRKLVELCEEIITSRDLSSVHRTPAAPGRRPEVRVDFGVDLSFLGLIANFCHHKARSSLVSGLLGVVLDAGEPENHRSSAVAALLELTPSLDEEEGRRVIDVLRPLAAGDYPAAPLDQDEDHPFSAIRVSMHIDGSLKAAALQSVGRLLKRFPELGGEWFPPLLFAALVDDVARVQRAGLLAAAEHPGLVPTVLITRALQSERPFVRANALRAWVATGKELPDDALALTSDEAPIVRMTLAELGADLPDVQRADLLTELSADPHPLVSFRAGLVSGRAPGSRK
jgi:tetratricopeptide (TPR) repeat protein